MQLVEERLLWSLFHSSH